MVQLDEYSSAFAAIGVNVAAMTYDSLEILSAFHTAQSLSYPLLHDENARHVTALGVLNEAYGPGDRAYGIPHPGIIYLDAEGVVRLKFAVPGYRKRPPLEDVLQAISTLNPAQ